MTDNASVIFGRTARALRESIGLSQEKLAERIGITYQYLSAIENGKENFTVGVLESIARAFGLDIPAFIDKAYVDDRPIPAVKPEFFIRTAPLPPNMTVAHVAAALNETHKVIRFINSNLTKISGRPLPAYIQANNFSGIVSNILCASFSRLTPYRHNHDQRYPDLVCKTAGGKTIAGLEVKSTIRPGKGGESHNGHSGWHVIACFNLNKEKGDILFAHIMFAELIGHDLRNADWKYVGSKVNAETGIQRTETYTTTPAGTAKLRHGTVYLDTSLINISRWRTDASQLAPPQSPFTKRHS